MINGHNILQITKAFKNYIAENNFIWPPALVEKQYKSIKPQSNFLFNNIAKTLLNLPNGSSKPWTYIQYYQVNFKPQVFEKTIEVTKNNLENFENNIIINKLSNFYFETYNNLMLKALQGNFEITDENNKLVKKTLDMAHIIKNKSLTLEELLNIKQKITLREFYSNEKLFMLVNLSEMEILLNSVENNTENYQKIKEIINKKKGEFLNINFIISDNLFLKNNLNVSYMWLKSAFQASYWGEDFFNFKIEENKETCQITFKFIMDITLTSEKKLLQLFN